MDEKIIENIIKGKGTILIFIDESGEIMMLTTGDLNKTQLSKLSKIVTILDDHSFVLKIVLWLEIFFDNLLARFGRLFKS